MKGNEKTISGLASAIYYISKIIKIAMIIAAVALAVVLLIVSVIPSDAISVHVDTGISIRLGGEIFTDELIDELIDDMPKGVIREGDTFIFPSERASLAFGMIVAFLAIMLLDFILGAVFFSFVEKYAKIIRGTGTIFVAESLSHLKKIGIMLLVTLLAPSFISNLLLSSQLSSYVSSYSLDLTSAVLIIAYIALFYTVKQGIETRERALAAEKQLREIDEISARFESEQESGKTNETDGTDTDGSSEN